MSASYSESKPAEEAATKRKERDEKQGEEQQERVKRQRVVNAFESILKQHSTTPTASSSSNDAAASSSVDIGDSSPQDILKYTDEVHQQKLMEIRISIAAEKRALENELNAKQQKLEAEAIHLTKKIKMAVLSLIPADQRCGLCQKEFKLLVGQCLGCQLEACAECLVKEDKCYLCVESWLGKKPEAQDLSSIRPKNKELKAKFSCGKCLATRRGYNTGIEYTRCCEARVCQDHLLLKHGCCVCSGGRNLCTRCGIGRCDRCGRDLCMTCRYKEGCRCGRF